MRVLCIVDGRTDCIGGAESIPIVGCYYEVIDFMIGPNMFTDLPGMFYQLEDMPEGDRYHESLFAQCDEIPEVEEKQECYA